MKMATVDGDILDREEARCVRTLFSSLAGLPPRVERKRYRLDNHSDLEVLDRLESRRIIETDASSQFYSVSPHIIPFIGSGEAEEMLAAMEECYTVLIGIYKEQLNEPITCFDLLERINRRQAQARVALYYLSEMSAFFCGQGVDFPVSDDSTVCVDESVIRRKPFSDYFSNHFDPNPAWLHDPFVSQDLQPVSLLSSEATKPEWYFKTDGNVKKLIEEIDVGLRAGLLSLPLMGIRALLEHLMLERIEDQGSFGKNLKAFSVGGFVSEKHAEVLHKVIDAGSAVIHRGHAPTPHHVRTCLDATQQLLHQLLVLAPQLEELSSDLPRRSR